MTWPEIAEKEGRIYCQKENTWCAFTDMDNGGCIRKKCIKEEREWILKLDVQKQKTTDL